MLLCLMLGREVIPAHFLHLDWSPAGAIVSNSTELNSNFIVENGAAYRNRTDT